MLTEAEQQVLAKLSIFREGCRREVAAAVTGADLAMLATLLDKSLLRRQQSGGSTHYDMHELIRQYAQEQPFVYAAIVQHHGQYSCTLIAEHTMAINNHRQRDVMRELQAEMGNIR